MGFRRSEYWNPRHLSLRVCTLQYSWVRCSLTDRVSMRLHYCGSLLQYRRYGQLHFVSGTCLPAILGDLIIDHVGRRKLMIFGLISVTFWLIIETVMVALYASPASDPPNRAGLAMGVAAL